MADSKIEWTSKVWNPIRGCTKVSPGCKHCYAERFAERWRGVKGHPYEQGFDLRLVPEKLSEPLRIRKPSTFFVNSMSDLFHEDVPDEYIDRVFLAMAQCQRHTFQVLTKRADRMREYCTGRALLTADHAIDLPLPNVWLGVSVESPGYLHRLDDLMATPAAVHWVSLEPLLADVDISPWLSCAECTTLTPDHCPPDRRFLDWVVIGGESGPGARPFDLAWARRIIRDCKAAGVPVFAKQLGRVTVNSDEVTGPWPVAPSESLRWSHSKGGDPSEWPADLRVREWPEVRRG